MIGKRFGELSLELGLTKAAIVPLRRAISLGAPSDEHLTPMHPLLVLCAVLSKCYSAALPTLDQVRGLLLSVVAMAGLVRCFVRRFFFFFFGAYLRCLMRVPVQRVGLPWASLGLSGMKLMACMAWMCPLSVSPPWLVLLFVPY